MYIFSSKFVPSLNKVNSKSVLVPYNIIPLYASLLGLFSIIAFEDIPNIEYNFLNFNWSLWAKYDVDVIISTNSPIKADIKAISDIIKLFPSPVNIWPNLPL